ncbi:MAG: DUF4143 domain-containing protein [Gammaproteobacteria bacterium]|nr:DUF4143 domain-containing protein [Gammaproteobacteria bacterium]
MRGPRAETFVACHQHKAVESWNDLGYGIFALAYLRDKEKREVDFVVVDNDKPWFLVEVKYRENRSADRWATTSNYWMCPMPFR